MKTTKMLLGLLSAFISISVFAAPISDATIIKDVQSKLSNESLTSGFDLSVNSNAGIVSLSGTLKNDQQAGKAIELAESTPGVTDVNATNLLVEKSNQPIADTIITAKIKGTFIREKLLGDQKLSSSVNVQTKDGKVVLTGVVDSKNKIESAINLAKSIDGVKNVESKLIVKSSSF